MSAEGNQQAKAVEDCLECRLTSGVGLGLIGAYLYSQSKRQSGTIGKITVASISVALVGLGVARLCNASFFRKS